MLATVLAAWLAGAAPSMRMNQLMARHPPPQDVADLSLPVGPLAPVGGDNNQFAFLDLDRTSSQSGQAVAVLFYVYDSGVKLGPTSVVAQAVERVRIDCNSGDKMELGWLGFDKDDVLVIWLPKSDTWEKVNPGGALGVVRGAVCSGMTIPKIDAPVGYAAAVRLAKAQMKAWSAVR